MRNITITVIASKNISSHVVGDVHDAIKIVRQGRKPGKFRLFWMKPCVYSVQRMAKSGNWNAVAKVIVEC